MPARGSDFLSVGARVSQTFVVGRARIEGLTEAFNLTNRRNVLTRNATFGSGSYPTNPLASFNQATGVGDSRSVQLGVRISSDQVPAHQREIGYYVGNVIVGPAARRRPGCAVHSQQAAPSWSASARGHFVSGRGFPCPSAWRSWYCRTGEVDGPWPVALGAGLVVVGELLRAVGRPPHRDDLAHADIHAPGPAHHVGPVPRVRNPLYLGNWMIWSGLVVASRLLWMLPIAWAVFAPAVRHDGHLGGDAAALDVRPPIRPLRARSLALGPRPARRSRLAARPVIRGVTSCSASAAR